MSNLLVLKWSPAAARFLKMKGFERALSRTMYMAGSSAAKVLRTDGARYVRDRKAMKYGKVLKGLPVKNPASRRLTGLVWRMDVSGKASPAGAFPARQTKKGVSISINRSRRALIKGAFIAKILNMSSLNEASFHRGVFIRKKGVARLPINHVLTTRISDVFGDTGMIPGLQNRALSVFSKSFDRLMPLEMSKIRPK